MKSLLIAIEGIDGSGKTTQIQLLSKYLTSKNIPFEVISFPRYEDNIYGQLVRRYLNGEFGSIKSVNPYLMALVYANDRLLAKPLIESWLNSGKVVISNRYVSSSKAHLSANLPEEKREEFMNWLNQLEYKTNDLPQADLNILLNIAPILGQKNVSGGDVDIHEDDLAHLEQASMIYAELCKAEDNWKVVNCMEGGKMRSKEEIHEDLIVILSGREV